jgi:hypothetical protein
MRDCHKSRNYSYLISLVEEAQSLGNRMEAKLADIKDYKSLDKEIKEKKIELKKLHEETKAISDAKGSITNSHWGE